MRRFVSRTVLSATLLATLSAGLAGCGGGDVAPASPASSGARVVEGAIVKGPLAGATVNFFQISQAGNPVGASVATATTNAQGQFSAALPASAQPLLAISSGGSYVDESDDAGGDNRRRITLGASDNFEAVLLANATSVSMTPYSMALVLRARRAANGANFVAVYEAVREQATGVFGFDPTTVIPGDPLAPDLSDPDGAQYALLLGGAAYAINTIAVNLGVLPTYAIVRAFIEDLSDGVVDGTVDDTEIEVKAAIGDVDLNGEILRFRNNHFDVYNGLLATLDEDEFSGDPPLPPLPPLAEADAISVAEGGTASSLVGGADSVLDNDSDTGGAALTAVLVDPPEHGSLELDDDGTFVYEHDGSETTTDQFTYKANNGLLDSPVAIVSITITSVNEPPVAVDDVYPATEDVALSILVPGVLGNDTDADGTALIAILETLPSHGVLSLDPDGSFVYTPASNFSGTDTFTYRASDGLASSNLANVTIRVGAVNEAPVARNDSFTMDEGSSLSASAPGLLANDSDADGDSLTAMLVTPPAVGSLNLNPNGSFNFTSPSGFSGLVTFEYRVTDGQADSNVATVRISVRPNGPPQGQDDFYTLDDGESTLTVPAPGVLANDSDPDGDPITAQLVSGPGFGTVALQANGGFVYQVFFDKAYAKFGPDQFTYRVSDGQAVSGIVTVTISFESPCDCASPTGRIAPALTEDGKIAAFLSDDATLVASPAKTTDFVDIFLTNFNPIIIVDGKASRAKSTVNDGTTFRLMAAGGAEPNGDTISVNITADGNYVVFTSYATNYVVGPTYPANSLQVYRYALGGQNPGEIVLVSARDDSSNPGDGLENYSAAISDDGNIVAFQSNSTDLTGIDPGGVEQVYLRDIAGVTTRMVSVDNIGDGAANGSGAFVSSISADGNLISFESDASNLLPLPSKAFPNGAFQTYVRNMNSDAINGINGQTTVMMSVNGSNEEGDDHTNRSWLSPDGSLIALETFARNLDGTSGTAVGDSEIVVHNISNALVSFLPGSSRRITEGDDDQDPDGTSVIGVNVFSGGNSYITFASAATNLIADDTNQVEDIFAHSLFSGSTVRVNVDGLGNEAVASLNEFGTTSRDGSTLAFDSNATNLEDPIDQQQVYVVANPLDIVTRNRRNAGQWRQ